jgi:hypothetical protein
VRMGIDPKTLADIINTWVLHGHAALPALHLCLGPFLGSGVCFPQTPCAAAQAFLCPRHLPATVECSTQLACVGLYAFSSHAPNPAWAKC